MAMDESFMVALFGLRIPSGGQRSALAPARKPITDEALYEPLAVVWPYRLPGSSRSASCPRLASPFAWIHLGRETDFAAGCFPNYRPEPMGRKTGVRGHAHFLGRRRDRPRGTQSPPPNCSPEELAAWSAKCTDINVAQLRQYLRDKRVRITIEILE